MYQVLIYNKLKKEMKVLTSQSFDWLPFGSLLLLQYYEGQKLNEVPDLLWVYQLGILSLLLG